MLKRESKCPKCGHKISPFYMKQNCPNCSVNLLYYKMDEQLEADAEKANKEVKAVHHFLNILKNSSVASPLLIVRLVLFFTPLASMCLPMYYAGSKKISLIAFIMSIINHGFDIGAMAKSLSYLFAVLAMVMIIVLSLAVIINSLFSVTKYGFRRNIIFSLINTTVFGGLSLGVCIAGGKIMAGFYVTMAIYCTEFVLHYVTANTKTSKRKISTIICSVLCVALAVVCAVISPKSLQTYDKTDYAAHPESDITAVSFNLAAPWGTSVDDTASEDRCVRFADEMSRVHPDFIGTQELNSDWLGKLGKILPEYDSYAVKRGGDSEEYNSEMNGVFWLKDKYTPVEKNTFWLSETPDKESKYTYTDESGENQEAGCNRICTYAVLKNNKTGVIYVSMNTHLDNSSEEARVFGASVIMDKIAEIKSKYGEDVNIILTGDFNNTDDSDAYAKITQLLNDTTDKSHQQATWHDWGYTDTGDKPIDFIFTSGKGSNYHVLDNVSGGYISDHYGIFTQIGFE